MASRWRKPDYRGEFPTLGWGLIDFMEANLRVPAGAGTGSPLKLTPEQQYFVCHAYRIHPVSGRMVNRRAVLRRPKGWGKSPIVGGLAVCHLAGPTVFDGWDADGEPVAIPHPSPWVQVAATAEDQTDNTWAPIMAMLAESPIVDDLGLDVGLTRIFVKDRPGRMEPVTARAPSKEGTPVTFACLDETHLWTPESGGVKLAATLRRNIAKTNGFSVETTNAHRPGEMSVAEASWEAAQKSTAGIYYDSVEGPHVDDLEDREALIPALQIAYRDSTWVDLERIADEAVDPATDPADARRFYLNQLVAWEEDVIELALWDALAVPGAELVPGDQIVLGFDGSDGGDSTALMALRHSDRTLFPLRTWSKPQGAKGWQVPRLEVRAAVAEAFERYRVARMYADPPYWQTDIDEWRATYGDTVHRWPSFSDAKMAEASARFDALVRAGEVRHNGDAELRRHIASARRQRCRQGWRPAKKDTRKIDVLLAALAAIHAHGDALAAGELSEQAAVPALAFVL